MAQSYLNSPLHPASAAMSIEHVLYLQRGGCLKTLLGVTELLFSKAGLLRSIPAHLRHVTMTEREIEDVRKWVHVRTAIPCWPPSMLSTPSEHPCFSLSLPHSTAAGLNSPIPAPEASYTIAHCDGVHKMTTSCTLPKPILQQCISVPLL